MEVFDAVRTALAIRNYKETPVPPYVVRRIVDAGLHGTVTERALVVDAAE